MKRSVRIALVGTVATLSLAGIAGASSAWSYKGSTGPKNWASLDPAWEACGNVDGQTPIDLRPTRANIPDLHFAYDDVSAEMFNNGHTVEAEPTPENTNAVTIDSVEYDFLQMHFHAPSEHKLRGKKYPVEIHFVNKSAEGVLAVVGVFIEATRQDNPAWAPFIEHLGVKQADGNVEAAINFDALLPSNHTSIQYTGSLTTPPCSGGVRWNVMSTVVKLSHRQIEAFTKAYSGNNRPIQPTAGRTVQIDTGTDGG
ncbi:unannotated protein [freshwater metagenome]|uniref:carbonic anhydrase n=1 Tax=freshwater metagenome TaxID=449393 RepID=A0A6J7EHC7_9ZZZZ